MSDELIQRLREFHELRAPIPSVPSIATEAASLIEQQAAALEAANARIAELEAERDALIAAAGKKAVAKLIYQRRDHEENHVWHDTTKLAYDALIPELRRIVYTAPAATDNGGGRDAERWRYQALDAQARLDSAVKILSRIHGFLTPEDVRLPDGRVMRFSNAEIEREMLRGLCAAIRAVPDEIAALSQKAGEQQ